MSTSKTRTLFNGKKVHELPGGKEQTWEMGSKCPEKYLVIDCETGDLWVRGPKFWEEPKPALVNAAKLVLSLYKGKHIDPNRCMVCVHRKGYSYADSPCNRCSSYRLWKFDKKLACPGRGSQ